MTPQERTTTLDLADMLQRLERLEQIVKQQTSLAPVQEFFTVEEFAQAVGLAPFTVREHCRHLRLQASKKLSGRGKHFGWVISREELQRYRREGLLPLNPAYRKRSSG